MNSLKKYLKKGSAEITGYLIVMPSICFFLIFLIAIIQNGMLSSKLQYATYCAARAAVVSEDKDEAKSKAEIVAMTNLMENASNFVNIDTLSVDIELVEGKAKSVSKKKANNRNTDWQKGKYLKCTLKIKTKAMVGNSEKTSSLIMMIERPSEDAIDMILNSMGN